MTKQKQQKTPLCRKGKAQNKAWLCKGNRMMNYTLHEQIAEQCGNICEIEALKDGKIRYRDTWHGFKPCDALNVMSVTKSVVSLLVGIALDKGCIRDIHQPVLDFFPDYPVKRGEKTIQQVTLAHLLTMTAPYKYKSEPWTKVCTSGDWTKAALDLLGGRAGITGEFKYSTLGIQILTGVITKASKLSVIDFANRFLFEPLGIAPHRNAEIHSASEQKAFLLSKQPKDNIWVADPQGVNTAGWGLCLSAADMAKLGQMCLNCGMYNGKRIVSQEWIAQSTKPHCQCGERFGNLSYGCLWWITDTQKHSYAAIGDGGNVIYVNPDANITVAVAATFQPRIFDRIAFIQKYIEPLLDTGEACLQD
ncbi:MAG: serine hydrolase [Oscillospiraceae bacterium]|nr:serine hydrolase [Oscillospiraceae bacterium]